MKLITDDGNEYTIDHVKMADVGPGDVLILRSGEMLSADAARRIQGQLQEDFPNIRSIILNGGFDIEILRRKADEQSKN